MMLCKLNMLKIERKNLAFSVYLLFSIEKDTVLAKLLTFDE